MNKYDFIFLSGIALWILETWVFGWNRVAQSVPEMMLDRISMVLIGYGAISTFITQLRSPVVVNVNTFKKEE